MSYPKIPGFAVSGQKVYEVSTKQLYPLGTKAVLGDRVFHYAKNSTSSAIAPGTLLGQAANAPNDQNRTWAGTANSKTVTFTAGASVTANTYAEGWFLADSGTGRDQVFKVREHTGGTTITVTLFDELLTTAASTPTGSLQKNKYADAAIYSGLSQALTPVGVSLLTVPAGNTTAQYFWCQTAGPAPLGVEGTVAIGQAVVPATGGAGDAGQVIAASETVAVGTGTTGAADVLPVIGYALIPNGTDEHSALIDLKIAF